MYKRLNTGKLGTQRWKTSQHSKLISQNRVAIFPVSSISLFSHFTKLENPLPNLNFYSSHRKTPSSNPICIKLPTFYGLISFLLRWKILHTPLLPLNSFLQFCQIALWGHYNLYCIINLSSINVKSCIIVHCMCVNIFN